MAVLSFLLDYVPLSVLSSPSEHSSSDKQGVCPTVLLLRSECRATSYTPLYHPTRPYLAWMPDHSMCCRWTTSGCFLINSRS